MADEELQAALERLHETARATEQVIDAAWDSLIAASDTVQRLKALAPKPKLN